MNGPLLGALASTFSVISLIAIGGANAVLPEVYRQVVTNLHWLDDPTFAKIVAIAQTAPGPNLLVVSLIGWQIAGLTGLLVATVAITAPSTIVALGAGRLLHRFAANNLVAMLRRALAPIAVGLLIAGGVVVARSADGSVPLALLTLVAAGLLVFTRINPIWSIVGGALFGLVHHLVV